MKRIPIPRTREEWLDMRRRSIGGSEIAGIAGLSKYQSPRMVWRSKTDPDYRTPVTEAMRMGSLLEDTVARLFCERTGKKVRKSRFIRLDPVTEYFSGNVDRFVCGEKAVLECKTAGAHMAAEWENGVPAPCYSQIQWYLGILGFEKGYAAVLIGGRDFRWYEVERDEGLIAFLREKAGEFWERYVLTGTEPPAQAPDREDILKDRKPEEEEKELPELEPALEERERLKKEADMLERKIKDIEARALCAMTQCEKARAGAWSLACKERRASALDVKRLQAEKPEVCAEYVTERISKPLVIRKKEVKNN